MDLGGLYQELILDHNAHPHNFGPMAPCDHHALGHNPLCGDEIEVFLRIEDNHVVEAKFMGHGCAISKASASMMTDALKGKSITEVGELFARFHTLLTKEDLPQDVLQSLGKLQVFSGVREYPARVKCATLAWHTLNAALSGSNDTISTE